ncbi:MAG TPA: dTDP-4-dehydrorhamnose 3,5-epimerase family protein [Candidatus Nanoarchaeia archaeon]|nr:dTDP-4-dehydrorhamnose 3,5-epimerase family protein [Candidatus Nanoarchaeia archaeon]
MSIADVQAKRLIVHADGRGYLFEGLRADDGLFGGRYGQCLISVLHDGVIKGLHLHRKQTDFTLCAKGRVLYVATDGTKVRKFLLDGAAPVLLKIPPGVWHGYQAIGGEALLVHIMDMAYDPADTEARDPHAFGNLWHLHGVENV